MPKPLVPDQLRHCPFTLQMALTYGLSRSALRGSEWRRLLRGVWVHRDVPDSRALRVAAVRLILPTAAFICGLTAAWIHGIEVRDTRIDLVWIGSRTGRRPRTRAGCLIREISVDESDVEYVDGLLVTTAVRTVFDCARWLAVTEAVVVADALAHQGRLSSEELSAYRKAHPGLRGAKQVPVVAELMDARSESPMETRLRVTLIRAGLPRPEAQVEIRDWNDRFVARVDLAYVQQRVVIEYDGAWHWETRRHDDRRRDALRAMGWTVIVVSAEDMRHPEGLLAEVRRALALGA